MTNTYLLEVIKALTPHERQEAAIFLDAPYFNRGAYSLEIKSLYQIILKAAPDFPEMLLNKETVYFQVFSDANMVSGKLEKLMAALNKLLRIYLLTQRFVYDEQEVQQQLDWAIWLREHGLAERSKQVVAKLKGKYAQSELESLERFRTDMLISEEEHVWELTNNQVKGDLSIPQLIHDLDLYYYNYRIELQNRYLLQQKGVQLPDFEHFTVRLDCYVEKSTILQISQNIFDALGKDTPTVTEVQGLMQLLFHKEKFLSYETLDHFYAYLRNFCTILINGGHKDFIPVLHQINKDNLARGYFFNNGKISPHGYLNLVQVAIRAKDYVWAAQFTETYKGLIIGGDADLFFYKFNLAHCLFSERKFEEALTTLPDAPSSIHSHHIIRRLELKIYYELQSDLLLYKLDAFRKYIERTAPKNIAPNLREMDVNFLKILHQLAQSPPKDKKRSARLLERIENKKLIADRAWLLEKAQELG